jgi:hypothetical protein
MEELQLNNAGSIEQLKELYFELRTEVFSRTKVDVVYSDIVNWEKNELLYDIDQSKKSSQKKFSYVEYTWLRIVEELRDYNFSYAEIKKYRTKLFEKVDPEVMVDGFFNQMKTNPLITEEMIALLQESGKSELLEIYNVLEIKNIELALYEFLASRESTSILFFREKEFAFPISSRAIEAIQSSGEMEEFNEFLKDTHLKICLDKILKQFVSKDFEIVKDKNLLLSEGEYWMITEVRKRLSGIKSVTVKYRDEKPKYLAITGLKKVKVESSLMAIIKSADYSTIEVITENGNVVCINHTEKIKL